MSLHYWPVVLVSAISLVLVSDLSEVPNSHGTDGFSGPYASPQQPDVPASLQGGATNVAHRAAARKAASSID